MAFGAVVAFIEDSLITALDEIAVFKRSNRVKMYNANIEKLDILLETIIYSVQLKNRILMQFQDLFAHKSKKGVILAFKFDVGEAISTTAEVDLDDYGYILAIATDILQRYMNYFLVS